MEMGERFGRLVVTSEVFKRDTTNETFVRVQCDCGTTTVVNVKSLRYGRTASCGCFRREANRERVIHGDNRKAGAARLYNIWSGINNRCRTNRRNYGQRGITNEFTSYPQFKEWALANGYNDALEIDRIEVNGNYCPGNCRWVTSKVNQNNKRSNRLVTLFGETKTLAEWRRDPRISVSNGTLNYRIYSLGWDIETALTTPARQNKKTHFT